MGHVWNCNLNTNRAFWSSKCWLFHQDELKCKEDAWKKRSKIAIVFRSVAVTLESVLLSLNHSFGVYFVVSSSTKSFSFDSPKAQTQTKENFYERITNTSNQCALSLPLCLGRLQLQWTSFISSLISALLIDHRRASCQLGRFKTDFFSGTVSNFKNSIFEGFLSFLHRKKEVINYKLRDTWRAESFIAVLSRIFLVAKLNFLQFHFPWAAH